MALTNFSNLNSNQLTLWSKDIWNAARQNSFVMQLAGSGPNSMIQRITELSGGSKGTQARITLVPDMTGDGVMGDTQLWDSEEALTAYEQLIRIDQLRNAVRVSGKMADQKVVVRFRETARDQLGYWLADRLDQIFFLTASGIGYHFATNGVARTGYSLSGTWASPSVTQSAAAGKGLDDLEFAADVTAPSAKRWYRWVGSSTNALVPMTTTGFSSIASTDTPSYRMLVELKAYAKDRRLRPLKMNGMETYHVFLHPKQMAKLKLDSDFLANIRNAGVRGDSNPVFSGSVMTVDGLVLHENTHVFNTLGATAGVIGDINKLGYKWGSTAAQDGARMLLCGAQAMAYADIGAPAWEEDTWDFKNQNAISIGKIIGFKKPVWQSTRDGSSEDYGVIAVDTAV